VTALLLAATAEAQLLPMPGDRPGDQPLTTPPPEEPEELAPILPPYPIPSEPGEDRLEAGIRVRIERIELEGNTVVSDEDLDEVTQRYAGRALGFGDLRELRDALTLVYVERGYVTSGAVIPEQTLEAETLRVRIVEGRLSDVELETDGRFREGYVRGRLLGDPEAPLNVYALERRLQVLRQDPRIRGLDAQLVPDATLGLSRLRIALREAPPWFVGANFDNYRAPSIGSLGGDLLVGLRNASGWGEDLDVRVGLSEGLRQIEATLRVPVNRWDTGIGVLYRYGTAEVIPSAGIPLEIASDSQTVGLELTQPVHRGGGTLVLAYLRGEWRRADTQVEGDPTLVPGSEVGVMRFGFEAIARSQRRVLAGRSTFNVGSQALAAPVFGAPDIDGVFFSWLGQSQWVERLPWLRAESIARLELQLAAHPLVALEQFAVGGRYTVRGYRQNQLVRDNGVVGSLELRIPLYERLDPRVRIDLAPFVDVGTSWNTGRSTIGDRTLLGIGIGLRGSLTRYLGFEFYWAYPVLDSVRVGAHDLQDEGINFGVFARWP
jgi:hemolysin activation/secretion protein